MTARRLTRSLVVAALSGISAGALLAVSPALAAPPGPDAPRATIRIEHRGPGRPSLVRVRVDPPSAVGNGEVLLSIYRNGLVNRRVLQPLAPGEYRAEYVFPAGGLWFVYMRFGPGQAGFVSGGSLPITPEAGGVDTFTGIFRHDSRRVSGVIQPLGYAAFGLIAALALGGVTGILRWLSRQPRPSGAD